MKTFLILLTTLFSTMVLAAPNQLPNNTTILGQKSSSGTKQIIFNNNQGASNTAISSDPIANDLTASGSTIYLKTLDTKVGTGAASSSPSVKFDIGGVSDPVIRYNDSTSKIEFSNDGSTFKGIGSGSGGGDGGFNFLENPDFEGNVTTGWVASGVTVTQGTYVSGTTDNQKYAKIVASAAGQYYESSSYPIPTFLQNSDFEIGGISSGTVGAFRVEAFLNGTSVASQTLSSATTFVKDPTIFFPVTSGTVKYRITSLSAGEVHVDNKYLGSIKNLKNGAAVESAQNCTATGTWIANTTYTCKKTRIGDNIEYDIIVSTSGAPTAAALIITLPSGDVIDTNKMTSTTDRMVDGLVDIRDGSINTYFGRVNYASTTTIQAIVDNTAGTYNTANGISNTTPITFGAGDSVKFKFKVPIVGLSGSSTTFDSRCPTDISCTNEFSGIINAAGTVSSESLDVLASCTGSAATEVTCTYNSGIFTVTPTVVIAQAYTGQGGGTVDVYGVNTTGFKYRTLNGQGTAGISSDVTFIIKKNGADNVSKRAIEGLMSKMTSHSGDSLKRETWGSFGGTGSLTSITTCTASPCSSYGKDSAITTVTRASAGVYSVALAVGSFSSIEAPIVGTLDASGSVYCVSSAASTSAVQVNCRNSVTGALTDWAFSINIKGTR